MNAREDFPAFCYFLFPFPPLSLFSLDTEKMPPAECRFKGRAASLGI